MFDVIPTTTLIVTAFSVGVAFFVACLQGFSFLSRYDKDDKDVEKARANLVRILSMGFINECEKCNAMYRYILAKNVRDGVCCSMLFGMYVRGFKRTLFVTLCSLGLLLVIGAAYMVFAEMIEASGGTPTALLIVRGCAVTLLVFVFFDVCLGFRAHRINERRIV